MIAWILRGRRSERMTDYLISQQAAVDALAMVAREKFNLSDEFNHYLAGLMDGEKAVRGLPEAVIRCLDCRHYRSNLTCVEGHYNGCAMWLDNGNEIMVAPDDYCSYAERREE
jgi:hypothetical protein